MLACSQAFRTRKASNDAPAASSDAAREGMNCQTGGAKVFRERKKPGGVRRPSARESARRGNLGENVGAENAGEATSPARLFRKPEVLFEAKMTNLSRTKKRRNATAENRGENRIKGRRAGKPVLYLKTGRARKEERKNHNQKKVTQRGRPAVVPKCPRALGRPRARRQKRDAG